MVHRSLVSDPCFSFQKTMLVPSGEKRAPDSEAPGVRVKRCKLDPSLFTIQMSGMMRWRWAPKTTDPASGLHDGASSYTEPHDSLTAGNVAMTVLFPPSGSIVTMKRSPSPAKTPGVFAGDG